MSLKKRNRRVQLALGREDLAARHAAAYLAGERSRWRMSARDMTMVRQMQQRKAARGDEAG